MSGGRKTTRKSAFTTHGGRSSHSPMKMWEPVSVGGPYADDESVCPTNAYKARRQHHEGLRRSLTSESEFLRLRKFIRRVRATPVGAQFEFGLNPHQAVVSTMGIAIIGVGVALWVVLAIATSFTQPVPGFITVYLPLHVFGTFPVWFGIPGLIANLIGGWLSDIPTKGFALSPNGFVAFVSSLLLYFMPGKGVSELKRPRDYVVWVPFSAAAGILILYLALFAYAAFGLLPYNLIPLLFAVTLPWVLVQVVIVNTILMKALTPFFKRLGLYFGTFWESRAARAEAKKEGTLRSSPS